MNAPSKLLTEDLWINARQPLGTFIPLFIVQHSFITTIILLVLISILAGVLASLVVFREARNKKGILKFGLLGFFNCFTIIFLIIGLHSLRIKKDKKEDQELIDKFKKQGYSVHKKDGRRKMIFIPLYSITYLILITLIFGLIEKTL